MESRAGCSDEERLLNKAKEASARVPFCLQQSMATILVGILLLDRLCSADDLQLRCDSQDGENKRMTHVKTPNLDTDGTS